MTFLTLTPAATDNSPAPNHQHVLTEAPSAHPLNLRAMSACAYQRWDSWLFVGSHIIWLPLLILEPLPAFTIKPNLAIF